MAPTWNYNNNYFEGPSNQTRINQDEQCDVQDECIQAHNVNSGTNPSLWKSPSKTSDFPECRLQFFLQKYETRRQLPTYMSATIMVLQDYNVYNEVVLLTVICAKI